MKKAPKKPTAPRRPARPPRRDPRPGSFAAKVRAARHPHSQSRAAEHLGVSIRTFQGWEGGAGGGVARCVPDKFKQSAILEKLRTL